MGSPSSNFLQWNPEGNNQETDSQYSDDSLRVNGAVENNLLRSITDNKFRFQTGNFVAAFGQMMVGKGYTINDSPFSTLVAVLGNVVTKADLGASMITVSYASSITFNAALASGFWVTLTGNVATSALSNQTTGPLLFVITQDSTGNRAFSWPSSLTPAGAICSFAGSTSVQAFFVLPSGAIIPTGPMLWITASGVVLQPTPAVVSVSSSGTVSNAYGEITEIVNCSGGAVTRSLYSAVGTAGFKVNIKRSPADTSTNNLMVQPLIVGQTIDGFPNFGPIKPYNSFTFFSTGANFILI